MKVDDHHNAGFYGNAKQGDVADPNGHAKVVAEPKSKNFFAKFMANALSFLFQASALRLLRLGSRSA